MRKNGLILLLIGLGIAALVCYISITQYGKVYFFDGYEITKIAWIASFGCIGSGLIMLMVGGTIWAIVLAVVLMFGLVVTCCDGCSTGSNSDKCAVCKGSGLVNYGFLDFRTCPVCKGSGVDFH